MTSAFPVPREGASGLPAWAWGIVGSSIAILLLWLVALIVLIVYEILRGRRKESSEVPRQGRVMTRPLSSPPVAISSPERPSSPRRSPPPAEVSSAVGAGVATASGPYRDVTVRKHLDVPSTQAFEEPEKDYRLTMIEDDASSTSSGASEASSKAEKKSLKESHSVRSRSSSGSPVTQTKLSDAGSPSGSARASPSLSSMVLSRPVTVRQLGATIREPGYIESEFRKLPNPVVSSDEIPPGAERKNRYSNVLPTPKTRVPLKLQFGRPNSDYVNANFIRGYKSMAKQYIATQGPMDNTIEDFWRMVWENGSEVIVMATNFQERGIDKCSRYWPAQGSEEYGNLEVTLLDQETQQSYAVSMLRLTNLETQEVRSVRHYRLTCWPLQGVPKTSKPVTDFLREIKMADSSGPAVVHCSAGIGRTAVLVAVDIGIQGILQGDPKVDILRIVSTMRQDRAGMVQTRDQYRFVHQALYDVGKEVGPQTT